jgi:hypothetical protein
MNFSATSGYTINTIPGLQPPAVPDTVKTGTTRSVNANSNLNTFTETLATDFTAYTNSGWLFAATFDYTYTYTNSKAYNVSAPILTPSIAKQLFKKKNGELRLTVFDVLNQNTSVSKSSANGNTTYSRTNVLGRYAMLTFTWNLNNFAGANQRRMPGMLPGMFRGRGPGGGPPGGGGFQRD